MARSTLVASALAAALVVLSLVSAAHADRPAASPRLEFVGNQRVSSDELRAAIASQGPLFDATGAVVQEVLERDLLLISAYYWDRGFALIKVGTPRVEPGLVSVPIEEGSVFFIGPVGFQGDLIGDANAQLAKIRVRSGDRFSRTMIATDRSALEIYYQDQGYAHAIISPLFKVDVKRMIIALTFEITRGKRARYERITITGNTRTAREPILRALQIAAGDSFSATRLAEAKRRVQALGVKNVVVSASSGSSDELVELKVEVTE